LVRNYNYRNLKKREIVKLEDCNYKRLATIVENFSRGRVLVIGDLMLDEFIWGTVERISPEAPVPVVKIKNGAEKFSLGGASNVAFNIKSLGGEVSLSGVIGNDENGREFMKLMENLGLDPEGIVVEKNRLTTHKLRVIAHSQQVVRLDREVEEDISEDSAEKLMDFVAKKLSQVNCVVISDYGKGMLNRKVSKYISKLFEASKVQVLIDPSLKNIKHYDFSTLIKPNLKEASRILAREDDID